MSASCISSGARHYGYRPVSVESTHPEVMRLDASDGPERQLMDAHLNGVLAEHRGPWSRSGLLAQKHLQAEVVVDDGHTARRMGGGGVNDSENG